MPPAKPVRAVDAHAHVFSATAPAVPGARYRPSYAARLADWRANWTAAGITHGVLTQLSFFGTDNREMLAAIAEDPEHLRGVAIVDPAMDAAGLRALDAGGVRAARLNLSGASDFSVYGSPRWTALFERIAALGWHVEVFTDAGRLADIAAVLAPGAFPIVFDHFGNPGRDEPSVERTFEAVAALAARRRIACKLSAPYRLGGADPAPLARRWLEIAGPEGLLWGSDWPWTQHEAGKDYGGLRRALDGWVPAALMPAVLWDNAARLYRFD